jgi:hypothetical protein
MIRVCSIDVGKVNLGVYIEEFSDYPSGKGLYLRRVDLTEKKRERVSTVFLRRLFDYLDTITIECDYYVIEKQLRANPEAQFVDHALQSYFVVKGKTVVSFSSKNKTKLFDESKMTKYQRKKWATVKAQQLLISRDEKELFAYVGSLKKKDDVSDAICQLDAWKMLHFRKLNQIQESEIEKIHFERSKIEIPGKMKAGVVTAVKPRQTRKKKEVVDKTDEEKSTEEKPKPTRKKKEVVDKTDEEKSTEEKPKPTRKKKEVVDKTDEENASEEKSKKSLKRKEVTQEESVAQEKPKKSHKKKVMEPKVKEYSDEKVCD